MQFEINRVVDAVGKEKNVDKDLIVGVMKDALLSAAKKFYGDCVFEAKFNEESEEMELWRYRTVIEDENFTNALREIKMSDASAMDDSVQIGDELGESLPTEQLGRIAAQAAKQVIVQKMSEAEKERVVKDFRERKQQLVSGIVRRFDKQDVIVDLGSTEGVLPIREQIPNEKVKLRDKVLCYLVDVKKSTRGPQVILSRAHPEMLIRLFEQEVTEIAEGIVVIHSAARDPGSRSKIAVYSTESNVDPVGACVGMKGARVQAVVQELRGEKIDIIPYDRDPARFVCNALAPAEVSKVIVNERMRVMEVVVPDDHLSLAIGKRGQNVRLAAQLTGWKLEIRSETKMRELIGEYKSVLAQIPGLGELRAEILVNEGYRDPSDIGQMDGKTLIKLLRLTPEEADAVIAGAGEVASKIRVQRESEENELDFELDPLFNGDGPEADATGTVELESIVPQARVLPLLDPEKVDIKTVPHDRLTYWMKLRGVGEHTAAVLQTANFKDYAEVAGASVEDIVHRTGLPTRFSTKLHTEAAKLG